MIQDRYLFAPTPPLVITHHDINIMSFLSPNNVEPGVSSRNALVSSTTIAASFQNEHRHVTPMPLDALTPVSSHNETSDCQKDIHTTGDSTNTIVDTTETTKSNQGTDAPLVSTVPENTSGKAVDDAAAEILTRRIMYDQSSWFPVVVHRMLAETCKKYDRSLVHWTDCGEYFWIDQKHSMLSAVLAKYFNRTFLVVIPPSFIPTNVALISNQKCILFIDNR